MFILGTSPREPFGKCGARVREIFKQRETFLRFM